MDKPTVLEVLQLVRTYYAKPGNGAGGCLHLVLDDGNIQDNHVEFCRDYARQENDDDGVILATSLLKMSLDQRKEIFMADKRGKDEDAENHWDFQVSSRKHEMQQM